MLPLLLHRDIIFETILVHSNPECFLWDRMIIKSYKTPHCNYANKRNICSKIDKIQSIVVQKLRFIAQKAFFLCVHQFWMAAALLLDNNNKSEDDKFSVKKRVLCMLFMMVCDGTCELLAYTKGSSLSNCSIFGFSWLNTMWRCKM